MLKRNNVDFFEQMANYKTSFKVREIICAIIALICILTATIILILIGTGKLQFTDVTITILMFCAVFFIYASVYSLIITFVKNSTLFLSGRLSAGLKNFFIVVFPIYIILLVLYFSIPEWKEFFISALTIVTTISVAILTVIGVHYTVAKQQSEKNDQKNLIFSCSENEEQNITYNIKNAIGEKVVQIKFKNISNNFGYLIGIYRICGCDAYQIGDDLPYLPLAPQTSYIIKDIKLNYGDDQLFLVYKDISNNFYYLLFSSNYKYIEQSDKCDMSFLYMQLDMTIKLEKKLKKLPIYNTNENLSVNELLISENKEKTKPTIVKRINNFDLIVTPSGDILTDLELLSKLKKERTKLAKEQQVKAYLIFNNQQLVAMATYKPYDELSFISIYGLGKKKYELYGKIFIQIIIDHRDNE